MTLLSPLDDPHEGSPTGFRATSPNSLCAPIGVEDLPPLVTVHSAVPAVEATPVRFLDEAGVRAAVGRFAAATLLPASTPETARVKVQDSWAHAVTLTGVSTHPDWMLAFIPGAHVGDALVHAVHLTTGHVFGGDTGDTVQQERETTQSWLDRLDRDFEQHAAQYAPAYIPAPDHA